MIETAPARMPHPGPIPAVAVRRSRDYLMCPPTHFTVGLNAVSDGHRVVLAAEAPALAAQLAARGFEPVPVEMSEFRKAGGGPKCCTLELRA